MDPIHSKLILQHVGDKIELSTAERNFFISLLEEKSFAQKTKILRPGEHCKNQYFIVKGCLKIFYLDPEGFEYIAKFAIENRWAFDIRSFFENSPAYCGIACLEPTIVLQLSFDNYQKLLDRISSFEKFYRLMLQQSFIALQYRMIENLSLQAEERYLQFQRKYPGLETRISQKDIASYLGITPVFLSMIRKRELLKH